MEAQGRHSAIVRPSDHVFTADKLGSRMGVCSARREGIRHEYGVGAWFTPPLL